MTMPCGNRAGEKIYPAGAPLSTGIVKRTCTRTAWQKFIGDGDIPMNQHRVMTRGEVAKELGNITESGVDKIEQSALKKLRRSPTLYLMWAELQASTRSQNIGTLMQDEQQGEDV